MREQGSQRATPGDGASHSTQRPFARPRHTAPGGVFRFAVTAPGVGGGAGLAARHPWRRLAAFDAASLRPPFGVPLAAGRVFRLAVTAPGLGDGAERAAGRAIEGGGPALDADPCGPAGVVAGAGGVAAGLALGRPVGRLAAARAIPPFAPLGIAPAIGLTFRLVVPPPGAGLGAGFAIGLPAGRRRRALDAEAGGAAFGMARAFRDPAVFAARLAHRPALDGRDVAAADAETGGPAGLAAPEAALPVGSAPGFGIAAAMRYPLGLRPGVAGAVAGAMLLGAGLAERALGARGSPAALGADAGGFPLGVLAAAALALVALRQLGILTRLLLGPEPCGAGAVRVRRRTQSAFGLPWQALGGSVVAASRLDIAVSHDGLLPANPEYDGGRPADGPAGRP